MDILYAFIQAETWAESRRILEAHPELLSEEADELIKQLIENAQQEKDEEKATLLNNHRIILNQSRKFGIESAFNNYTNFHNDLRNAKEKITIFDITGDPIVLEEIISTWERIINNPILYEFDDPLLLVEIWNNAGSAYFGRYMQTGEISDLDSAITLLRKSYEIMPPDDPYHRPLITNLGAALIYRYECTGREEDLEEGIRALQEAVEITPPDHPGRYIAFANLSMGLIRRYMYMGRLEDLEEAIRVLQEAVESLPPYVPDRNEFLINLNLAVALIYHYERTGQEEDLEEGIRILQGVVEIAPPHDYPTALAYLGTGLIARYERTGREEDLEEGIRILQEAVEIAFPSVRPIALVQLGLGLVNRYTRTGQKEDAEESIRIFREAMEIAPPHIRPVALAYLGAGLIARYERTGQEEDLEEGIRALQEAGKALPMNVRLRPTVLVHLGAGLIARYERTGQEEDLEEGIRALQEAVEIVPPPIRAKALILLGAALLYRYERTGQEEDWEEGIRILQESKEIPPVARPTMLLCRGTGMLIRYERTGQEEDLEEGIRALQEAVEIAPQHAPARRAALGFLSLGLITRYGRTGREKDLEEGIHSFKEAHIWSLRITPVFALSVAQKCLARAFRYHAWKEVLEVYEAGMQAARICLSSQFRYTDKAFSLKAAQGLPARAAFSAWHLGQSAQAIEILELGRAQLLREVLERQRRDLHALQGTQYEPYYSAYIQATRQLEDLQSIPYNQRPADWSIQIDRAQAALEDAIEALRRNVPGFTYFLKSLPFPEIQRQAIKAPLVYLLATEHGGLALIVRAAGQPQAIMLPELTEDALSDRLSRYFEAYQADRRSWFAVLDQTTRWLWDVAMGRVVEALAGARSAVLIPTGLLGFLPLHAAWREDPAAPTGRRYALDDLLLTYAPSAHALAAARQVAARAPADRLFAVDNPDGSLLFSAKEVAAALKHFAPDQRRLLGGEAATRKAVLEEIPRYSVLHFATHGRADLEEPLWSGLWMADGALSLGDLMDLRLEGARLAVLSACETGLPGAKLPDEVVSLPSGLIQVGVAGVVGSLWAVNEVSTALLMARFYDLWRKEGLEPPEALRQAQIWLRDSTNTEKEAFFRDALPELGATRRFQDLDFAHPFYWAAFSYVGA
jgi:CHAT domain-containing protein